MRSNVRDEVVFATPLSFEERTWVAGTCSRELKIELPVIVDHLDDRVERAYTAWPDRLYVVDRDGRVAYKSRPGPFGFQAEGVEKALESLF